METFAMSVRWADWVLDRVIAFLWLFVTFPVCIWIRLEKTFK